MVKDNYHFVIAHQALSHLYQRLKKGESVVPDYFSRTGMHLVPRKEDKK